MLSCLTFRLESLTFICFSLTVLCFCVKFTEPTDTTLASAYNPRPPHPPLMGEHGSLRSFRGAERPKRRRAQRCRTRTVALTDGHLWREKQESAGKLVLRSTLLSISVSQSTELKPSTVSGWKVNTHNFVQGKSQKDLADYITCYKP